MFSLLMLDCSVLLIMLEYYWLLLAVSFDRIYTNANTATKEESFSIFYSCSQ